ncbi:MAG: YmL10 [Bogoriella megaspora]|nr:MAG: YmL10 [Bogoriella megaspora]
MPPRLWLPVKGSHTLPKSSIHPIAPFLLPFLQPQFPQASSTARSQQRHATVLSNLSSPSGAYSKNIRRGRGPSSGKGKTSGRGHKGQKQHGKVPKGFTGGQTKLEVVHGKRGFKNVFATELSPLNLDRVQTWIDEGRLNINRPITLKELAKSRCVHGVKADGIKLLARDADKLTSPINIVVSRASAAAIAAVERAGGQVMTRYYTWQSIRRILLGESHPTGPLENFPIHPHPSTVSNLLPVLQHPGSSSILPTFTSTSSTSSPGDESDDESSSSSDSEGESSSDEEDTAAANEAADVALAKTRYEYALGYRYRLPNPASRKAIEYYRDPAHRGYLAHTVKEGEGPSLFFRKPVPRQVALKRRMEIKRAREGGEGEAVRVSRENRLW